MKIQVRCFFLSERSMVSAPGIMASRLTMAGADVRKATCILVAPIFMAKIATNGPARFTDALLKIP